MSGTRNDGHRCRAPRRARCEHRGAVWAAGGGWPADGSVRPLEESPVPWHCRPSTRNTAACGGVHGAWVRACLRWGTGRRGRARQLLCATVSRDWCAAGAGEDVCLVPLHECECVRDRQTDRHPAWVPETAAVRLLDGKLVRVTGPGPGPR